MTRGSRGLRQWLGAALTRRAKLAGVERALRRRRGALVPVVLYGRCPHAIGGLPSSWERDIVPETNAERLAAATARARAINGEVLEIYKRRKHADGTEALEHYHRTSDGGAIRVDGDCRPIVELRAPGVAP